MERDDAQDTRPDESENTEETRTDETPVEDSAETTESMPEQEPGQDVNQEQKQEQQDASQQTQGLPVGRWFVHLMKGFGTGLAALFWSLVMGRQNFGRLVNEGRMDLKKENENQGKESEQTDKKKEKAEERSEAEQEHDPAGTMEKLKSQIRESVPGLYAVKDKILVSDLTNGMISMAIPSGIRTADGKEKMFRVTIEPDKMEIRTRVDKDLSREQRNQIYNLNRSMAQVMARELVKAGVIHDVIGENKFNRILSDLKEKAESRGEEQKAWIWGHQISAAPSEQGIVYRIDGDDRIPEQKLYGTFSEKMDKDYNMLGANMIRVEMANQLVTVHDAERKEYQFTLGDHAKIEKITIDGQELQQSALYGTQMQFHGDDSYAADLANYIDAAKTRENEKSETEKENEKPKTTQKTEQENDKTKSDPGNGKPKPEPEGEKSKAEQERASAELMEKLKVQILEEIPDIFAAKDKILVSNLKNGKMSMAIPSGVRTKDGQEKMFRVTVEPDRMEIRTKVDKEIPRAKRNQIYDLHRSMAQAMAHGLVKTGVIKDILEEKEFNGILSNLKEKTASLGGEQNAWVWGHQISAAPSEQGIVYRIDGEDHIPEQKLYDTLSEKNGSGL